MTPALCSSAFAWADWLDGEFFTDIISADAVQLSDAGQIGIKLKTGFPGT